MKPLNVSLNDDSQIRLSLNSRQVASTREAKGLSVECLRGSVWITLEDGGYDHVLNPGERLPINTARRVVIEALTPSEVAFVRPQPAPAKTALRAVSATPYAADCWVCL